MIRRKSFAMGALFLAAVLAALTAAAQAPDAAEAGPVDRAVLQTRQDIARELDALNKQRARIAAQRKPLADRLDALQKRVAAQRTELEQLRRLQQQGEEVQAALSGDVSFAREQCRFLVTALSEYARAMETRAAEADSARLRKMLEQVESARISGTNFYGLAEHARRLLSIAEQWNRQRVGGEVFDGVALDADGIEHPGRFATFGPAAFFAGDRGPIAGIVVTRFGTTGPALYDELDPDVKQRIRDLVADTEAIVPVDVTAGDAIKIRDARRSATELLEQGGFVMFPLLLLGAVALILAVWKTIEFSRIRVHAGEHVALAISHAKAGRIDAAEQEIEQLKEPLVSLVSEAIERRDSPRDHLEEIMHEHVLRFLPRLERHLGTLAVLGGVAPLLGLLGTVTGMIRTFQLVTIFGSGDAKLLSGGISEALITTMVGLAIAIPVLLVHAFLTRRARTIIGALEMAAVGMVNDIKLRGEKP